MAKFRPKAERFLAWLAAMGLTSEVAKRYQKRFAKYGDRLFAFLAHDGVPWNNNLAENALKLIASRRRLLGASYSKEGMHEYLLFLSLYQTLRRRGLSLLPFLLSGQKDVLAFEGKR